jgi:hypothetical protein
MEVDQTRMATKAAPKEKLLHGTWWRVPEQDDDGVLIFRKEGTPLPPARGRSGFTLHAGGRATLHGPGPTDRRESRESRWSLDAQGRLVVEGARDAAARVARIDEHTLALER